MKIYELLKLLEDIPPDAEVMLWQDGERSSIESVDWWDDGTVDLNAKGSQ